MSWKQIKLWNQSTVESIYSGTSEQGTHWGHTCFVLCREVVLFSEVVNVLKLYIGRVNINFGTSSSVPCIEV